MIYEFECSNCGEIEEKMMKVKDMTEENYSKQCKECGGILRKKISLGKFSLKGSGWYRDEYTGGAQGDLKSELSEYDTHSKNTEKTNKALGIQ